MAAAPRDVGLEKGIATVLEATTVADARAVFRAIRLAQPGGMGAVPDHDVAGEPTMNLRDVMRLAAGRDLIARQYDNGFEDVLTEGLPALRTFVREGRALEIAIVGAYLHVLARYPDSLIARKAGADRAQEVSDRAGEVLDAGWPDREQGRRLCDAFDDWLRGPARLNPGTTADLVTAALYAALRDGTIPVDAVRSEVR
jgi:triphosphoribosyl-dephospho-CoA synthase